MFAVSCLRAGPAAVLSPAGAGAPSSSSRRKTPARVLAHDARRRSRQLPPPPDRGLVSSRCFASGDAQALCVPAVANALAAQLDLRAGWDQPVATHAMEGAGVLPGSHPLVIFSHGLSWPMTLYQTLAEDLRQPGICGDRDQPPQWRGHRLWWRAHSPLHATSGCSHQTPRATLPWRALTALWAARHRLGSGSAADLGKGNGNSAGGSPRSHPGRPDGPLTGRAVPRPS